MLDAQLRCGLAGLDLTLEAPQEKKLLDFLALLHRWNQRMNLTAIREPSEMVSRHLLDSLSVMPYLLGSRFIDVGSGGGMPGIPLAICNPAKHFVLLDSNGKKTRFLVQAKATLALDNVHVVHARVQDHQAEPSYDAVLTRAFASLDDMIEHCRHLVGHQGQLLAMKGQQAQAEIDALAQRMKEASLIPLQVPGLEEERCLVRLRL